MQKWKPERLSRAVTCRYHENKQKLKQYDEYIEPHSYAWKQIRFLFLIKTTVMRHMYKKKPQQIYKEKMILLLQQETILYIWLYTKKVAKPHHATNIPNY